MLARQFKPDSRRSLARQSPSHSRRREGAESMFVKSRGNTAALAGLVT
jgi:hypothetical protein